MLKRLFDITLSATGLVLLLPVLIIIAILVKLDSKGPALYDGTRVGLRGKPFKMHKFRTMVANAAKIGGSSTPADDPRITRMGSFLRSHFQLDELPQLINILKGEMSFVGPRPEVSQAIALYSKEERLVLSVPPGLTDYASIWNPNEGEILRGSDDPEKTYNEKIRPTKIRLQLKYVKEHSFMTDLRIIAQTAITVLTE